MMKNIRPFLLCASMFRKAVVQYMREIVYFLKAKRRYIFGAGLENNPNLVLRKRTHHLERYLFAPGSYVADFAQEAAADIEKILESESSIPVAQAKWARKILEEFKSRSKGGSAPICPLLINNMVRKASSVSTENLMELLRHRRSRRVFIDMPLTEAEKIAICNAAQYAPSSCNRQTIYLIFVEEPQLKEFVASTVPGGYQFFSKAPCILLLISDAGDYRYPDDRVMPFIDGAAAAENIYLLCETMGLGCCWGSYLSFGSIINETELRQKLKIPATHLIVGCLAIGKSNQVVCEIPREPAENRFWNNYYGNRPEQS
jgi:nitroreductase